MDVKTAVFRGVDKARRDKEPKGHSYDEIYGLAVRLGHLASST